MLLGLGVRANEMSDISQTLAIPGEYSSFTLRYWYWIASTEECGKLDIGVVRINDSIAKEYDLCSTNNTNGWREDCIEINDQHGQDVTFHFEAKLDGTNNSNFFIDDVSLALSCDA